MTPSDPISDEGLTALIARAREAARSAVNHELLTDLADAAVRYRREAQRERDRGFGCPHGDLVAELSDFTARATAAEARLATAVQEERERIERRIMVRAQAWALGADDVEELTAIVRGQKEG